MQCIASGILSQQTGWGLKSEGRASARYLFSAKGANQDCLGQRARNSSKNKFSSAEIAIHAG
jgi:hypothetical protein